MNARPYNFNSGPAALPLAVLERARDEMLDWRGSGRSVMELGHRGSEFGEILNRCEADLRTLMSIPSDYRVLFLQGGATLQFSLAPMNLLDATGAAVGEYLLTGHWSEKALKEAAFWGKARQIASSKSTGYDRVPDATDYERARPSAYLHYCSNETIGGVEFTDPPAIDDTPLIADVSSNILSRPIDVSRHGMLYAGAQKNMGPSGLTVVIIRSELLERPHARLPGVLELKQLADHESMVNTPPTWSIYVAGLVFQWLIAQGGVEAIAKINARKAAMLYETIDGSGGFYRNPVRPDSRSRMNVPFTLAESTLDERFLTESKARGLLDLKGHRSVGGMRASIYNAMPLEGVQALCDFMREFARTRG